MTFEMNLLTMEEVQDAWLWNKNHSPYQADKGDISVAYLLRKNDPQAIAVFQDNNGYPVDGKLTQRIINRILYTKYRTVTYYSSLPEYHIDMQLVHDVKPLDLIGDIILLVCGYDGIYRDPTRMSKRYGDCFGLDTGTVGWPHYAAGTLKNFIQYLVDNHRDEVYNCLKRSLPAPPYSTTTELSEKHELEVWEKEFDLLWSQLSNKRWLKRNVKDGPHNKGIFEKIWWRRFLVEIVRNKVLRQAQTEYWLQDIFADGLKYFKRIGLTSERGLAICVRYRNSQKMGRSVIRAAKQALVRHGETAAIEVIFKYYERYGRLENKPSRTRGRRISMIRKAFKVTPIKTGQLEIINGGTQ